MRETQGREPGRESGRLLSLDVFRGITIAGMIIVNTPGNDQAYSPLEHAAWNGCTPTDLVFPFFLFIVGTSIVFSLAKRKDRGDPSGQLFAQILKRTAVIFGLGLFLNAIPNYHPSTLRLLGVLQRIALCYLVCSVIFWKTSLRAQGILTGLLLAGYWLLMTHIPVPGYGAGDLSKEGSLASYLDRVFLGRHIYRQGPYDPEGILSTIPSIATTLIGMFAGYWLRTERSPRDKAAGMILAGTAGIVAGRFWAIGFPLNKALWTSPYVLYTGGLAFYTLAACYWLSDIRGWRSWGKPFEIFGVNAIAAYVLPILLLKALILMKMPGPDGKTMQLRIWLCDHAFGTWLSPLNASFAFAFTYMLLWLGVFWLLYRKRLFLKI